MNIFGLVGACFAAFLSWGANASPGWCALHALFGWFYVLYHYICIA